jgi:tRNA (guanine37-N1)-methyltransferase
MKSPGVRVPRSQGETARRDLIERRLLRDDLEILNEGEYLVLPIVESRAEGLPPGELVSREFAVGERSAAGDYRDLIAHAEDRKTRLPRAFDVVGDIVLVRVPEELDAHKIAIGEALLAFVPSARIVGQDLGVHGSDRRRRVERLAGTGGWRTRHRENGLEFDVDLERAYFSPRLAREHAKVAEEVRPGERVYDLCCGVGPFAVTIARDGRAASITAVDSNPVAIELLRSTLTRYPFRDRVEPIEATLEAFAPRAAPADRVVYNLPLEGIKYASSVGMLVSPRGRLHYYEITPRTEFDLRAESIMRALGPGPWVLRDRHIVHPYSPTADLAAYVFGRSEL